MKKINLYLFTLFTFSFASCFNLVSSAKITNNYYLVENETQNNFSICWRTQEGDFIGKIPPKIIEYGCNNTFLVAKTIEYNKTDSAYYIIDMSKDSELEHEDKFRIGPLSENIFDSIWKSRLNINMLTINANTK